MALDKGKTQEIVGKFGKSHQDTGSTEVQIALLTAKIEALSTHLQKHVSDFHSQRGLLKAVGQRRRLLSYLERSNYEGYKALIQSLGLRH
jgi:small subunit ribosomal protein S15